MRFFKAAVLWLVCTTGLQSQISVIPTVSHVASPSPPYLGGIHLSVSGGVAPYTYSWNPGAFTTQDISAKPFGAYSVKVTDSHADTASYTYHIGYKVNWASMYGCEQREDTLITKGLYNWGQAISKNTLAGGTDGWFEYVLKDLDQIKAIGFTDSLSSDLQHVLDIDYGFYYADNHYLYTILNESYYIVGYMNASEPHVLRIERKGDTIRYFVNGVDQGRVIDPVAVQKAWKIKGNVLAYNNSSLVNVGCSFYQQGNTEFPNYTRLVPEIIHNSIDPVSGLPVANGSIKVRPAQSGTCTYTWQPGSVVDSMITSKPAGVYKVTVEDFQNHKSSMNYHIGYKVNWASMYDCEQRGDSLITKGLYNWGQAISKNTLAGGTDGWFEYVLKDLDQIKAIGFTDSLSPDLQNLLDIDYGFYYADNHYLYTILNGSYYPIDYMDASGPHLLRIERKGDTIRYFVNGVGLGTVIDPVSAQKAWKVKGNVLAYNNSSLVNVGCSFYQQGNADFPNYTRLIPAIVHSSGIEMNDGSIQIQGMQAGDYQYTWQPGSVVANHADYLNAGLYTVAVSDSLNHTSRMTYHVGYKTVWDSVYGALVKPDTLETTAVYPWGRAVSKNKLATNTDGWFEYVLKDLNKIKLVGFLDSMSTDPQDIYDIDYGYYYDGMSGALYTITKGAFSFFGQGIAGSVLRVERVSDTILLKMNGIVLSRTVDTVDARKPWNIKGIVHGWADTRLVNVGCSFVPYSALVMQQDVNCTAGINGSITVTAAGGIPPYTYAFNNGSFSSINTFTNLAAGTYTVDVQDGAGTGIRKLVDIVNCPKWVTPYSGVSVNAHGDILKTASDSSWTNAVLTTEEPFLFSDTAFWLSFETPDTGSVFMLGFRTRISDSLLILSDSALQITNYKLYVEKGMVTVVETDNDGFFNKFEIARATIQAGFKIRLTKSGIEYYRRPNRWSDYTLIYISKLFSPAKLIVEETLYKSGSRTNAIRVSAYGNTN